LDLNRMDEVLVQMVGVLRHGFIVPAADET
jgi:hypothetical protein